MNIEIIDPITQMITTHAKYMITSIIIAFVGYQKGFGTG